MRVQGVFKFHLFTCLWHQNFMSLKACISVIQFSKSVEPSVVSLNSLVLIASSTLSVSAASLLKSAPSLHLHSKCNSGEQISVLAKKEEKSMFILLLKTLLWGNVTTCNRNDWKNIFQISNLHFSYPFNIFILCSFRSRNNIVK